jgi:hypothetical protein
VGPTDGPFANRNVLSVPSNAFSRSLAASGVQKPWQGSRPKRNASARASPCQRTRGGRSADGRSSSPWRPSTVPLHPPRPSQHVPSGVLASVYKAHLPPRPRTSQFQCPRESLGYPPGQAYGRLSLFSLITPAPLMQTLIDADKCGSSRGAGVQWRWRVARGWARRGHGRRAGVRGVRGGMGCIWSVTTTRPSLDSASG